MVYSKESLYCCYLLACYGLIILITKFYVQPVQNENHSNQKNWYFIYITLLQCTPHWIAENDLPPTHKTCMTEWHNLENCVQLKPVWHNLKNLYD
jgi:hypothetical protein